MFYGASASCSVSILFIILGVVDRASLYNPVNTGVLISPKPDQEGSKLQKPNSKSCKPLKNNFEGRPFNQVSAAAMTSASDEKWRPLNCFSRVGLRTYQHPCNYNQLGAQMFLICLLLFSTCFVQLCVFQSDKYQVSYRYGIFS